MGIIVEHVRVKRQAASTTTKPTTTKKTTTVKTTTTKAPVCNKQNYDVKNLKFDLVAVKVTVIYLY
jgi:hypothetical protein